MVRIARVEISAYRQPLTTPVATSFGLMRNRPAVFVRIEDADGAHGWGEIFANWPASGAEHRCRLVAEDLSDLLIGHEFDAPQELFAHLDARTHIRALQCGEQGPFAQCIAGLDIAAWDLFARHACIPLHRYLNPRSQDTVATYASGIHIDAAPDMIAQARSHGFDAAKIKVGFAADTEPAKIAELRENAAAGITLMADANQAWDEVTALTFLRATRDMDLAWLEEPIIATAPPDVWQRLANASDTPLAAGENIAGHASFDAAIAEGHLRVIQPDVAKWGGITGCHSVATAALRAGRSYCPHFLGGGIGLAASAHLLATAGGDGRLEVDANPNDLRDAFGLTSGRLLDGRWPLSDAPGLGIDTLPEAIERYRTCHIAI